MITSLSTRLPGTVLKRHKILKQDNNYYTLDDFNINKEVTFYGRRYTIYKCDKYTRDYLINLGIQVPPDNEEIAVASEESKLLKVNINLFKDKLVELNCRIDHLLKYHLITETNNMSSTRISTRLSF